MPKSLSPDTREGNPVIIEALEQNIIRIIDVHICEDKEMRDMFVELLDTGFQKGTVLIDKLDKSDGRILI